MEYEVRGTTMQTVEVRLQAGESVYTEAGGMAWMSDGINMDTNMKGGLLGGLKRMVSGESLFLTDYSCTAPQGFIVFTGSVPGKIIPIELQAGESVVLQRNAFLCASSSVQLEMHLHKRLGTALFGGEGLVMQKATGPGVVMCEVDGEVIQYNLQPGQMLKVDPGHVAMLDPTVQMNISTVPGLKNMVFGGEGVFLTTLTGPGRIWLQSLPLANLARSLTPFLPKSSG